jgi:hypothetical protein
MREINSVKSVDFRRPVSSVGNSGGIPEEFRDSGFLRRNRPGMTYVPEYSSTSRYLGGFEPYLGAGGRCTGVGPVLVLEFHGIPAFRQIPIPLRPGEPPE